MPGRIYTDETTVNDSQNTWPDAVIIRPAAPDAKNGVFATWEEAHAQAVLLPVPLRKIWIDSPGAAVNAGAGVYDMDRIQICGMEIPSFGVPGPSQTLLTGAGCSFTNWLYGSYNVAIEHQGPAPLFVVSTAGPVAVIVQMGARVTWRATAAPVLSGTGDGFLLLTIDEGSTISGIAGFEPIELTDTCTCQLNFLGGGGNLTGNALRGPAATQFNIAPQAGVSVNYAQANFVGTLNTFSIGPQLVYVAGNPADWVAPPPTDFQSAADRIAAQLAIVGAAPIP